MKKSKESYIPASPWNISSLDKILISPNKKHKVDYVYMSEVAMGAPLSGLCVIKNKEFTIELGHSFGCPPVWSNDSKYLAIPMWTENLSQELAIVDMEKLEIKILDSDFRVLYLKSFENGVVVGEDSPKYEMCKIEINIDDVKFRKVYKLTRK